MGTTSISKSTLQRLPSYITYLKSLPKNSPPNISATTIANALGLGEVQVRKDLAAVTSGGKPKVGYAVVDLIRELDQFLGYNDVSEAVLVGCGKLGHALLDYRGFNQYGLKIVAGFDSDPALTGVTPHGQNIFPMEKLNNLCSRLHIRLGVIAVPAEQAQSVCDDLVDCGIQGILNLAPVHLNVPAGVIVENENVAVSLANLAGKLDMQYRSKTPSSEQN